MRFYCDVHRLANKSRKKTEENYHVYTTDGVEFGKAERIADIPAKSGDELYVDVIPVELTDEFIELLRRGVRVYRLRRLDQIPNYRNGVKSARNDVLAMMSMDTTMFKEVSADFLEMSRLASEYREVSLSLKQAKQRRTNSGKQKLKDYTKDINRLKSQKNKLARKIINLARQKHGYFNYLTKVLGINTRDSLYGKAALGILLNYVDFSRGLRKILVYVGNYYPHHGKYNKIVKEAAESLAMSVFKKRHEPTGKEIRQVLKTIRRALMAGGQA
ncbi:hypothetical protein HRbin01_01159 [archaeon HR01]|nr:hypothetical protein HRbin01_01159 [archaeon HR01]